MYRLGTAWAEAGTWLEIVAASTHCNLLIPRGAKENASL